ncbi:MAG: acetolactate synthase small subunit [Pseudomonadota bacterium]
MRHVISVLVQNEVGALTRLTGLFSTRGYNIQSLNVAPTEDPAISRLTVVTSGSDAALEQIARQINKLVDVVDLHDMTLGDHFERELALIKLRVPMRDIDTVTKHCQSSGARVLDQHPGAFTVEYANATADVDRFVAGLTEYGTIVALVRSGSLGISRGATVLAGEAMPDIAVLAERVTSSQ